MLLDRFLLVYWQSLEDVENRCRQFLFVQVLQRLLINSSRADWNAGTRRVCVPRLWDFYYVIFKYNA